VRGAILPVGNWAITFVVAAVHTAFIRTYDRWLLGVPFPRCYDEIVSTGSVARSASWGLIICILALVLDAKRLGPAALLGASALTLALFVAFVALLECRTAGSAQALFDAPTVFLAGLSSGTVSLWLWQRRGQAESGQ